MATRFSLHDSTGHWLARLFSAMRAEFDDALRAKGVTMAEWAVLAAARDGVRLPSEVAAYAGVSRAVVSRSLERLEERGLITREPSQRDRRAVIIGLTRTGSRVADALVAENERINAAFASGLSAAEMKAFRRTVQRMLANRPREANKEDPPHAP